MGRVVHGCALTTEAVRRAIQRVEVAGEALGRKLIKGIPFLGEA
jgi:hypothetical protein